MNELVKLLLRKSVRDLSTTFTGGLISVSCLHPHPTANVVIKHSKTKHDSFQYPHIPQGASGCCAFTSHRGPANAESVNADKRLTLGAEPDDCFHSKATCGIQKEEMKK